MELSNPAAAADESGSGSRRGMWATVALLLVLLVLTAVALFLVVLHYRSVQSYFCLSGNINWFTVTVDTHYFTFYSLA